jgi:hypothetical protein
VFLNQIEMKKTLLTLSLMLGVFIQKTFSQDPTQQNQLSQLLSNYYNIKDALVAGDATAASAKAQEFVKSLNTIDYKTISEGNINALLKDATVISESKELEKQRKQFSNFSDNMAELAKQVKLSSDPIYLQNCPMKKANWLSKDKGNQEPLLWRSHAYLWTYYGNHQ